MSLCEMLGIKLPILQSPMAGVQGPRLAAAVSGAGGLGAIPAAAYSPETLSKALMELQAQSTQPYNLNFFCHSPPQEDIGPDSAWFRQLQPEYRQWGIDPAHIPTPSGYLPFNQTLAEVLDAFRPAVVSFHFGLPAPELLARVKALGCKVLSSATTLEEAVWLEKQGVDAIIAQGAEAGGHRGMFLTDDLTTQVGTFALLPQIVAAVRVPVIAAGGIADARTVRAALALGASAVQAGTAYLLCPEADTRPLHRQALQSPSRVHTALTNVFSGRPARGIVNHAIRRWGPIHPDAPSFPLGVPYMAPLRAAAEAHGSSDYSPLWCGQNASGCREIPAAALTRELAGLAPV